MFYYIIDDDVPVAKVCQFMLWHLCNVGQAADDVNDLA
jgi:hypothetical protein